MICRHLVKKKYLSYGKTVLFWCANCGLVYSSKNKKKFNPQSLYHNYYKNESSQGRFNYGLEHLIKIFRLFRAFKIFLIAPKAKSILDIGCGRGFMLYFLKKYIRYSRAVGTQFDQKAVNFARNKLGLEIYNKDLLELRSPHGSFDLISMWHVLEHVKHPEQYLKRIYFLLKKGGKLIIEVPNFNSWTRAFTEKYWLGLDLKYHLYFFKPGSLIKMLEKQCFKIKNVHSFSLEYSVFFSVQSLVSRLTKTNQLVFEWLQGEKFSFPIIFHLVLFALLTPLCFLINLCLFFSKKGEILLVAAQKN